MSDIDIEKIIEEHRKADEEFVKQTYENVDKLHEQIDKEGIVDTSLFIELLACYDTLHD